MRKIKVIAGGCGINYVDDNGRARHALKTAEDGPFECDDAQAERLVRLGVAKYVGDAKVTEPEAPADSSGQPHDPEAPAQTSETIKGHLSAEDLEAWDYNDLKKLAADMGVEPKGKKKADYIAAIVAVEVEAGGEVDLDDGDELPELDAADPE